MRTTREFRDYLVNHWKLAAKTSKDFSRVDNVLMSNIISNLCSDIEELEKEVERLTGRRKEIRLDESTRRVAPRKRPTEYHQEVLGRMEYGSTWYC